MDKAQPSELVERWTPLLGERVIVVPDACKPWGEDWVDAAGNPLQLYVAAIRALPGGGVDVTTSETWPLEPIKVFGSSSLTGGFVVGREGEADQLRPAIERLTPTPEPCRQALVEARDEVSRIADGWKFDDASVRLQTVRERARKALEILDSALSTSPAEPEEATEAMLEAGEVAWQSWGHDEPVESALSRIYVAMHSAAPIEKREGNR